MTDPAWDRAAAAFDLGRFEEAARFAGEGLRTSPEDGHLWALSAGALEELGQVAEAGRHIDQALVREPENPWVLRTAYWVRKAQGRHDDALAVALAAVRARPQEAANHHIAGSALVDQAQQRSFRRRRRPLLEQAAVHAHEAIRLAPDEAFGRLGMARIALVGEDRASAEHWAREALAVDPTDPIGHLILGSVAEARGDVHAAGSHYLDSAKASPGRGEALNSLRGMGRSWPVSGLIIFLYIRFVIGSWSAWGPAAGLAVAASGMGLAWLIRWRRTRRTRRRLPTAAVAVLDADERSRPRPTERWRRR